jgi:hypothetical protein
MQERLKEAPRAQPPARPLEKAQAWLQGLRSGAKMDKAVQRPLNPGAVSHAAYRPPLLRATCLADRAHGALAGKKYVRD